MTKPCTTIGAITGAANGARRGRCKKLRQIKSIPTGIGLAIELGVMAPGLLLQERDDPEEENACGLD